MQTQGFSLFQTLIALMIVSTSLMFILDMTINNLRHSNTMTQAIDNLTEQVNTFELELEQKQ